MSKHHQTHPEIVKRLKRANGHLAKIISMIEHETPCLEVAQQFEAVVQALLSAKKTFVQDHISHCLDASVLKDAKTLKKKVADFKEITKYL